jgi:predicted transcriptional regulator
MQPNTKIDKDLMYQMLKDGKGPTEIAKLMGCSKAAVSKASKCKHSQITRDIVLKSAHKVVSKSINAVEQLQDINDKAKALLDRAIEAEDNVTVISCCKEIRGQLSLQLEIFRTLYDYQEAARFQQVVLEEIGAENEECKKRIVERLKHRAASSSVLDISGR